MQLHGAHRLAARALLGVGLAIGSTLASFASASGQTTDRASVDSSGNEGNSSSEANSISGDGTLVAFESYANNLVSGDTNLSWDIFVHDRTTGLTSVASVDSSGTFGDSNSFDCALSADGLVVAFWSVAANLVSGDTNGFADVFVHDLVSGVTERVSVDSSGNQGDGDSRQPSISGDGRFVSFWSVATDLVPGDTNGWSDVFVHDRMTGVTERMSVDSSGVQGNSVSTISSISADGLHVAFESLASNLVSGDMGGFQDIFVHDRTTTATELVSVDSSGAQSNDASQNPSISGDGNRVAFWSGANNLVSGDTNNTYDVFAHDRTTGATVIASVDSSGNEGNSSSEFPSISADGRFVAFESYASNLVSGDTNGVSDIFVRDLTLGTNARASVDSSGNQANYYCFAPSISGSGTTTAFWSAASNLVSGDFNGAYDIFVREPCVASWANYGTGYPGTLGVPSLTASAPPVIGTTISITIGNSLGKSTGALVFAGDVEIDVPTPAGGSLLVLPTLIAFLPLPASGLTVPFAIPNSNLLCDFVYDLQVLEADSGAAHRISFTPGMELIFGV